MKLDMLNMMMILDKKQFLYLRRLSPHLTVFDTQKPRAISSDTNIPGPVIATIANWLISEV